MTAIPTDPQPAGHRTQVPIDRAGQPAVSGIGTLSRWKLTEPVRLYVYSVALVLIVGLQLAGWLTGQWVDYAISSAGVVLAVGAGGEAARASVYSPAGVVRELRKVTGR